MTITSCGQKDCLERAAERSGWHAKRRELPARGDARRVFGIGMASLFHVGGGAKIYRSDGCGTILKVDDFGHVTLITGSSEIGQGSETVLAQIVSSELGLPIGGVRVINNDTDLTPWDVGVHASRTTFIAGNSALRAARGAARRILDAAAAMLERPAAELALSDGSVIDLETGEALVAIPKVIRSLHFSKESEVVVISDYYEPPSESENAEYKGNISPTYAFATQVAEVEVDLETGVVRVLKLTSVHDVGKVINRLGIEGQVEGGVLQGMGYCLTEDLKVEEGRVVNPDFTDYKLPAATDLPEFDIDFVETHDPDGPFGAKGIGEAPIIPVAVAIANAVRHATGVRFHELPLTPERVFRKLRETRAAADNAAETPSAEKDDPGETPSGSAPSMDRAGSARSGGAGGAS
jgi:xanthine dehydrogenase molybdenum-binding subunit